MYKVIVVDDETIIKQTLKKLINDSTLPFQVIGEAEDGREALKLLKEVRPELVISDIRMPVMGGLDLVKEALKIHPSTVFIILSGHDDFSYAQQALRFGVADYLLKPLKPKQLEETLRRVFDRILAEQHSEISRSEWILYCKDRAKPLAKHLWLLNMQEAARELSGIHRELTEKISDNRMLQQAYRDLITFVEGEMALQGDGGKISKDTPPLQLPAESDAILTEVNTYCRKLLEMIRDSRNWASHSQLRRASDYIAEHFADESLSLQEVADMAGMSPSYFSRSFKEEFGISFSHHLTKLRMEKAMTLLSDPDLDSKSYEIAYGVGYKDYPHFTKVFKKYWGLPPSEVKKRI